MDMQRMGLYGTPSCILPSIGAVVSLFTSPYTHLLKCPCTQLLISVFKLLLFLLEARTRSLATPHEP